MARIRIAVTGTHGQIVRSLVELCAGGDIEVVTVGRPLLDLSKPASIASAITEATPDVLVSAAGYTDVDRAEIEEALATTINAEGPGALAATARSLGIPIVHISTDYVFDGRSTDPYRETDHVNPLGAYGRSKLKGEWAVTAANPQHVILRTGWIYSPFGTNFVKTMLGLARRQETIRVVCDRIGNPTSAVDIAAGILTVARRLATNPVEERYGIFHMTASDAASWAEFAAAIFEISATRGGPYAHVVPITSAEYRACASRPSNSQLDCTKISAVYGISLPPWRGSLALCVDRILENRG